MNVQTVVLPAQSQKAAAVKDLGYAHIPGVIPKEKVSALRALVQQIGDAGNVHNTPIFQTLIEELRIHEVVQQYFDTPIYYTGWTKIRPGDTPRPFVYHDDCKGRPITLNPDKSDFLLADGGKPHDAQTDPIWPNYRLFIYLDDHVEMSGGTKIRTRSHRLYDFTSSKGLRALARLQFGKVALPGTGYVNPPARAGDGVLFNLKCKHSGFFVRLCKPLENVALPVAWDNTIKRFMLGSSFGRKLLSLFARPFPTKRVALTIDFCTDSDWARGFQINRVLNPMARHKQPQLLECSNPQFVGRMQRAGLPILNNPILPDIERFLRGTDQSRNQ